MVSVSKYLKDTEDTAPHVSVSVSQIHFKSIFPNPDFWKYLAQLLKKSRHSYNYQPQRSRSAYDLGNMYGYSSMADTDWGWKKRKRSLDSSSVDKRHIAHWAARGNGRFRPRRY